MKFFLYTILVLLLWSSPAVVVVSAEETSSYSVEELKKMPIKKLRQFLAARGLECKGCAEKDDFVKLCFENKDVPPNAATASPKTEPANDGNSGDSDGKKDKDMADLLASMQSSGLGGNFKMFSAKDFEGMSADQMAQKMGGGGSGGGNKRTNARNSQPRTRKTKEKRKEEEGDHIEL